MGAPSDYTRKELLDSLIVQERRELKKPSPHSARWSKETASLIFALTQIVELSECLHPDVRPTKEQLAEIDKLSICAEKGIPYGEYDDRISKE